MIFIALAFGFILHVSWYAAATLFFIQNKIINDLDFLISYTASSIAKTAGFTAIYDLQRQADVQAAIRGPDFLDSGLLPFNHPPFLVPLYALIFPADYPAAFVIWQGVQLALLVGIFIVLARMWIAGNQPTKSAFSLALPAIVFYPTLVSVWKGQDTVILLGAVAVWALGLLRKDDRLAGLALAVATIRPQVALGLALAMLFTRKKVFTWFVAGSLVLGLYSLLLVGVEGVLDYLQIIRYSTSGELFIINQQDMFNLLGLLIRLLPGVDPGQLSLMSWLLFLGAILIAGTLWWKWGDQDSGSAPISLSILLVAFASPHLHYHDLSILIVALLLLVGAAVQKGILAGHYAPLVVLGSSLVLMIADASPDVVRYAVPYLMGVVWVVGWMYLGRNHQAILVRQK